MDKRTLRDTLIALHPASFGWAMVCCRQNRDLAEDVLQIVYVRVLNEQARFDGKSAFRTWLFAVIRNTARSEQRWWSRIVRLDFKSLAMHSGSAESFERGIDGADDLAAVRAALAQLPERQREVIHLVFYEDRTIEQAAGVMQVGVGSARQHYARGKDALRKSLKNFDASRTPDHGSAIRRRHNPETAPTHEG